MRMTRFNETMGTKGKTSISFKKNITNLKTFSDKNHAFHLIMSRVFLYCFGIMFVDSNVEHIADVVVC